MRAKPVPTFSWGDIDALHTTIGLVEDLVPASAFTLYDYAHQYGLCRPTAEGRLRRMVFEGKLTRGHKRAIGDDGRMRMMTYYWKAGK